MRRKNNRKIQFIIGLRVNAIAFNWDIHDLAIHDVAVEPDLTEIGLEIDNLGLS